MNRGTFGRCGIFVALMMLASIAVAETLTVVVMDPLSKPLSCDCVRGYAQRDYNLLAKHLESTLRCDVKIVWFESLAEALEETGGRADLVIGKSSVVLADERSTGFRLRPIAQLTGKDGSVTQTGLIVVRKHDPAKRLEDLNGYQVLFGPVDTEEKSSAAEKSIKQAGVELTGERQRFGACSEAATELTELPADTQAAAVISSYAEPLLAGCGSIKKGDLRVIGETDPVPFITAFVSDDLDANSREQVLLALITAGTKPQLLTGLETLAGFVPWSEAKPGKTKLRKASSSESAASKKKMTVAAP